jgi:signal transduction histidine kinase
MSTHPSDVIPIIFIGTALILLSAGLIITLIFFNRQRYKAHQQELIATEETNRRKLLQSQLDTQNQTLQQIGHELHDNIGQLLSVIVMHLNMVEDETSEPGTQQSVQETRELVRTVIADVRMMSKTLDYDAVSRFGLLPSLRLELERIQRAGRLKTNVAVTGESYTLDKQTEMVLLRMAQEALNNAIKHAQAKTLTITADYNPDNFVLAVSDDGRGFDMSEATTRNIDAGGNGLSNLQQRAGMLGGTCTITSQPGAGSRIEIRMPRQLAHSNDE